MFKTIFISPHLMGGDSPVRRRAGKGAGRGIKEGMTWFRSNLLKWHLQLLEFILSRHFEQLLA